MGYSPWGRRELAMTERLSTARMSNIGRIEQGMEVGRAWAPEPSWTWMQ